MKAKLVDDLFGIAELINHRWTVKEADRGNFKYYAHKDKPMMGMLFGCPGCGCVMICAFTVMDGHPSWTWDGNEKAPTLTPSIIHTPSKGGCGWHGFLTKGEFKAC
jgi:hypothetical protein